MSKPKATDAVGSIYINEWPSIGAYIGMTTWDAERRWRHHAGFLRRGTHGNRLMLAAWQEHGEGTFRVLETVVARDRAELRVLLPQREAYWFARLQPTLNIAGPGGGRI